MPEITKLPSISDPQQFQAWVTTLKGKSGWVCAANTSKSDGEKCPISATLKSIAQISIARGTPDTLELNLMYACFLASRTPAPDKDINAAIRDALADEKLQRKDVLEALRKLQDYLEVQRSTALKAIAQTDNPKCKVTSKPTELSAQRLDSMKALLADFEHGLLEFTADTDHIAAVNSADFRYGPFEFDFDIASTWKRKGTSKDDEGMTIIHTGLMFHLTYLFRYFTCETLPKTAAFFHNEILMLDGVRMISVGKPNGHHVAALTNAVFGTQYSSSDVKDRLTALKMTTPGSTLKKNPHFVGW